MNIVDTLKGLGEPTRLRIIVLLAQGELSVGELVDILGMSQPRLSRHLNILTATGLIERLPEGAWVFYRIAASSEARHLFDALRPFLPTGNAEVVRDLTRLTSIQEKRQRAAEDYFNRTADNWDDVRAKHYPIEAVERALIEAIGSEPIKSLVDLGTGTGKLLTLFANTAERLEGIDLSHKMLTVARANLERSGVKNASVRQGDVLAPPFEAGSADLVTIHQVLHYLDAPEQVILEATRILEPGGRVFVIDFAPHGHEFLRRDHKHRHLGFSTPEMDEWMRNAGLEPETPIEISAIDDDSLHVNIWSATKPPGH